MKQDVNTRTVDNDLRKVTFRVRGVRTQERSSITFLSAWEAAVSPRVPAFAAT